jgi:uncharacterized OB-fold protein
MKKVEVVRCSKCGREIEDRTQFCSDCGSARSHLRAGRGVKIAISVVAFAALLFGLWVHLGTPVPASLVGLDLPFMGRQSVVTHDTTFYPGADIHAVIGALVANQLLGDVGELCDQGITCEGRQIIKAGTRLRVVKEIALQNDRLNITFAHVKLGGSEGWVVANAIQ